MKITPTYDAKVKKGVLILPGLLAHEQGHVDISDQFASMTESALKAVIGVGTDCSKGRASLNARDNWDQNMQRVFDAGFLATEAAQALYDLVTGHGTYE